jgi:Tfp pilus assembly protein PilF
MKIIRKTILSLVLLALFMLLQSSVALAENMDETAGINEAKKLYVQALPMDILSPERIALLDQAEAILKDVIKEHPQSLDAHRKLMGVYLLKQDYSNSIRTMQEAITLSPEDPKLFISLAFLYEHSGSLEFSKAMLEQALKLDPENKVAQDYKLVIQQKIDVRNQDAHQGKNVMGSGHGSQMPPDHGSTMSTEHPPVNTAE